jgi:hypothetical protein
VTVIKEVVVPSPNAATAPNMVCATRALVFPAVNVMDGCVICHPQLVADFTFALRTLLSMRASAVPRLRAVPCPRLKRNLQISVPMMQLHGEVEQTGHAWPCTTSAIGSSLADASDPDITQFAQPSVQELHDQGMK